MAAEYPATVATIASNKADATTTATDHPAHHNKLAEEVVAVQTELGTDPAGASATVKARLDTADSNFFGRWVPIFQAHLNFTTASAGTYLGHATITANVANNMSTISQYLDPADLAITGKTLKYRVVAGFQQNAANNAATSVFTTGLYPLVPGGASTAWTPTNGTVIAGSTAVRNTQILASDEFRLDSGAFTAPAADNYALGCALTTATAAGALRVSLRLDYNYA